MTSQESRGTTHLMVLNFVVKYFESWQIGQGFVKRITNFEILVSESSSGRVL